jgi:hypothetical protein
VSWLRASLSVLHVALLSIHAILQLVIGKAANELLMLKVVEFDLLCVLEPAYCC